MKYPRTYHLPYSKTITSDDKKLKTDSHLLGKEIVITEKLDGENTVMSNKAIHARSEDGYGKPWQTYMKQIWSQFKNDIPDNMYICGENLYAVHSILYEKLDSYFYVFGIIDGENFLSWNDTEDYCKMLNLSIVPVLYRGKMNGDFGIPKQSHYGSVCEGYVCRVIDSFLVRDFNKCVAKVVRENHVQTDEHWTKNWKKAELI